MRSKVFTPTYMKSDEYCEDNTDKSHFSNSYSMSMNSLLEMSMYQLFNEKLSSFVNMKYHDPYEVSVAF